MQLSPRLQSRRLDLQRKGHGKIVIRKVGEFKDHFGVYKKTFAFTCAKCDRTSYKVFFCDGFETVISEEPWEGELTLARCGEAIQGQLFDGEGESSVG